MCCSASAGCRKGYASSLCCYGLNQGGCMLLSDRGMANRSAGNEGSSISKVERFKLNFRYKSQSRISLFRKEN